MRNWFRYPMKLLFKWLALSWAERRMLGKVALLLGLTRLGLTLLPFRVVQRVGGVLARRGRPRPAPVQGAVTRRTIWAINALGKRMLGTKPCLTQALVTQWLLQRQNIDSVLRIGVAKDAEGRLLAHAWVEREGIVLVGGGSSPHVYVPLAPLTGADS